MIEAHHNPNYQSSSWKHFYEKLNHLKDAFDGSRLTHFIYYVTIAKEQIAAINALLEEYPSNQELVILKASFLKVLGELKEM